MPDIAGRELATDLRFDCNAEPFADLSADARWLQVWVRAFEPDAGMQFPARYLALVDLDQRAVVVPAGQPPLAPDDDAYRNQPRGLCWDDETNTLHVAYGQDLLDPQRDWWQVSLDDPRTAHPGLAPPAHCRVAVDREWSWAREVTHTPRITRGLRVREPDDRTVELVHADGTLLARHGLGRGLVDDLLVSRYAWSPGGERLVYTMAYTTRWWFSGPSHTYVVDAADGTSGRLDRSVYRMIWPGDDELVGCTSAGLRTWNVKHRDR